MFICNSELEAAGDPCVGLGSDMGSGAAGPGTEGGAQLLVPASKYCFH